MSGAAPGRDSQAGNMGYPGAHCARYSLCQALGLTNLKKGFLGAGEDRQGEKPSRMRRELLV